MQYFKSLLDAGTNAGWLKLCFGYTVAHSFEGSSISCSGTTLGTRPVMEQYLNYQTQFSTQHPLCGVQGVDQSIHNYIISKVRGKLSAPALVMAYRAHAE